MNISELKYKHVVLVKNRFLRRVDKNGPLHKSTRCWLWTGGRTKLYGKLRINGRHAFAHRISYCLFKKKTINECVLHRCDNPICVNPAHLFVGTQQSNVVDRDCKDRQAKGEENARSKLTNDAVKEIRNRYIPRCIKNGQKALAKEFGVEVAAIQCVIKRLTWRHVK